MIIDCHGTGQDGDIQAGLPFTRERFTKKGQTIVDHDTGLTWLQDANVQRNMSDWHTAFERISKMNSETAYGYSDWRLPNIVELESVTDLGQHSPALPDHHPFHKVQDFYWSSTTSMVDPDYAWALYLADGAVGVGHKPLSEFYLWPVRGRGTYSFPSSSSS